MPVYTMPVGVIMSSGNDDINDGEGDDGVTIDLIFANVDLIVSLSLTEF